MLNLILPQAQVLRLGAKRDGDSVETAIPVSSVVSLTECGQFFDDATPAMLDGLRTCIWEDERNLRINGLHAFKVTGVHRNVRALLGPAKSQIEADVVVRNVSMLPISYSAIEDEPTLMAAFDLIVDTNDRLWKFFHNALKAGGFRLELQTIATDPLDLEDPE